MTRIISLLLFVAALICLCSANQNTPNNHQNNLDPCQDPTSPQYNQAIPWQEIAFIGNSIFLPNDVSVNMTDTTGCLVMKLDDFEVSQNDNTKIIPPFSATMRGNIFDQCGGKTYYFTASQNEGQGLSIPSAKVQSATLEPLTLTGFYYSNVAEVLTITTDRASFYATSLPFYKTPVDGLSTDNTSPCQTRVRSYTAGNFVYSRPFHLTVTLAIGQTFTFTFPADVSTYAYYYDFKFFYAQCTCSQTVTAAAALSQSSATTAGSFTRSRV